MSASSLDISRQQSGKLAIERKPADLSALLRDVVEAARNQLKEHALLARLPDELWLSIDPLRIEQVATNLLDNAPAQPRGRPDRRPLTEHAESVQFCMQDRGVGVRYPSTAPTSSTVYQAQCWGPVDEHGRG